MACSGSQIDVTFAQPKNNSRAISRGRLKVWNVSGKAPEPPQTLSLPSVSVSSIIFRMRRSLWHRSFRRFGYEPSCLVIIWVYRTLIRIIGRVVPLGWLAVFMNFSDGFIWVYRTLTRIIGRFAPLEWLAVFMNFSDGFIWVYLILTRITGRIAPLGRLTVFSSRDIVPSTVTMGAVIFLIPGSPLSHHQEER